jgi:DNA replication and repair protein RecF
MPFSSIRLSTFRNLRDAEINVSAERVILVGENGQGKTNFLEAVYYLSFGSSFRGSSDAEAAKEGVREFSLNGSFRSSSFDQAVPAQTICVGWSSGAKSIRIDGKSVRDRKELVELNPAIVFCHEDYAFAAGEPERRRFFFDQTAGLVSLGYIDALREYKKILRQKNAALKERRQDIVGLLDVQLVERGIELIRARMRLRDDISQDFSRTFEAVARLGEEVSISYRPNWPADAGIEDILRKLESRRADELAFGTSLSGPHRDRWGFLVGSEDFAAKASTGQLRLISLTLRMAQAEYYTRIAGRLPMLLLDDVLLELDRGKRARFLERLPAAAQAFFTFLPGDGLADGRAVSALVYEVKDGWIGN